MKEIKGINLKEIVNELEEEDLREKREKVSKVIRGIKMNIYQWEWSIEDAEKKIAKWKEKLKGAKEKLTQIKNEKWDVIELPEKKPENAPEV